MNNERSIVRKTITYKTICFTIPFFLLNLFFNRSTIVGFIIRFLRGRAGSKFPTWRFEARIGFLPDLDIGRLDLDLSHGLIACSMSETRFGWPFLREKVGPSLSLLSRRISRSYPCALGAPRHPFTLRMIRIVYYRIDYEEKC